MAVPAVSVLIPVRNGERYLAEALDGVLADNDPTREVIVVDDGSDDGTPALLEAYKRKDLRLIVARQEPSGVIVALERGRRYARAPLIARLDADDVAYPGRLAAQIAAFRADPGLVLLGSALDKIDEAGRRIGVIAHPADHARLADTLPRANAFSNSSIMMRRDAVEAVGGYRTFFLGAEDYDLWLRLVERGRVGNLPARLGAYRVHSESYTQRSGLRQAFGAALARRCAEFRRAGRPDPSMGREDPINLDDELAPHEPLAADVRLFRALSFAEPATFQRRRPTDADVALITAEGLRHAEKRLAQAAIANMVRLKARPPSLTYGAALARVIRIDPRRAFRLLAAPVSG